MGTGRFLLVSWGLLSIVHTQSVSAQATITSARPMEDIEYQYRLVTSENRKLCKHMGQVFNAQFRRMWLREPMPVPATAASPYSPSGKFAFQRVEGVEHDDRKTFQMGLSKLPSTPEFDAISWRDTRVTTGGPPNVELPESKTPRPALIAYVDFDNDGQTDTLIKYGFTDGYEAIRDRGESHEYLSVLRGMTAPVPQNASLWNLKQDANGRPAIRMNGQYLRPLIYASRTYVASYEMEFIPSEPGSASPGTPTRETMTLLEFQPFRTGGTVCQFEMMQIE